MVQSWWRRWTAARNRDGLAARARATRPNRKRRSLQVEGLETRNLLSGGSLLITGLSNGIYIWLRVRSERWLR